MRPLWSRAVAIIVAVVAVAAALAVLDRGSYVATLRIERHAPPIDRPAREVASFTQPALTHWIPASRIHASHAVASGSLLGMQKRTGELRAMYGHASATKVGTSMQRRSRQIVLRDPRPDPAGPVAVSASFLLPLFGRDLGPPDTEVLALGECHHWDELEPELDRVVARLDAWLVAGTAGTFEARIGSRWRSLHGSLLVLVAAVILLAPMLLFRIEVEAGPKSLRVVRRFGPLRRVLAEVLAAEIKTVRVAARERGPFTFHRPTLSLHGDRVVELWPCGRLAMLRALEDREALALLVAEAAPRGEGAQPFRGEG